jgi:Flp pilus assembly protein TadD
MRLAKKTSRSNKTRALALYKMALSKRPNSPDALVNVGKHQLKTGQGGAAVSTLERCRKARPRYTPCLYWLGLAHQRSGRASEAKKAFEAYLDVNPDGSLSADVRKRLGL